MGQIFDQGRDRSDGTGETRKPRLRERSHSIYIEGKPHPKERPRVTKTGHAFTPERTRKAEKRIGEAWDGPMYHGPVHVQVIVDPDGTAIVVEPIDLDEASKLRGDLDNYLKTCLDSLNGIAWDDDRQVVKITAVKL